MKQSLVLKIAERTSHKYVWNILLICLTLFVGILLISGSFAAIVISDNSIILEPSSEPENPVFGMIYLDEIDQFRFYNGERWVGLIFEDDEDCKARWECDEWGDCINDYQTRSCENLKPICLGEKSEESRSCESEAELPETVEEEIIEGIPEEGEEIIEEVPEEVTEEVSEEELPEEEVTISS